MKRRDFLTVASGVAGGAGAGVTAATAQETTTTSSGDATTSGNETTTAANGTTTSGGASGGGGPTREVIVGPGGNFSFDPAEITIAPGTTIRWVWEGDNHNVVPSSQPEGANWEGTAGAPTQTYDTGHEYSHTFETTGTYEYYCEPHRQVGMTGSITVQEGGPDTGGSGEIQLNPEHMGVPFQAHFVGLATVLMIVVSLIYTFFLLKYGESPHTSGSNR